MKSPLIYEGAPYYLKPENHNSREEGMCAMEFVSFLAGEKHTDMPRCADLAISILTIGINDDIETDRDRTRILGPHLENIVGTRSEGSYERTMVMTWNWFLDTYSWLLEEANQVDGKLDKLRALPKAESWGQCLSLADDLYEIFKDDLSEFNDPRTLAERRHGPDTIYAAPTSVINLLVGDLTTKKGEDARHALGTLFPVLEEALLQNRDEVIAEMESRTHRLLECVCQVNKEATDGTVQERPGESS